MTARLNDKDSRTNDLKDSYPSILEISKIFGFGYRTRVFSTFCGEIKKRNLVTSKWNLQGRTRQVTFSTFFSFFSIFLCQVLLTPDYQTCPFFFFFFRVI